MTLDGQMQRRGADGQPAVLPLTAFLEAYMASRVIGETGQDFAGDIARLAVVFGNDTASAFDAVASISGQRSQRRLRFTGGGINRLDQRLRPRMMRTTAVNERVSLRAVMQMSPKMPLISSCCSRN